MTSWCKYWNNLSDSTLFWPQDYKWGKNNGRSKTLKNIIRLKNYDNIWEL